MVLKVKEPVAEEYPRLREGQTLFTYLHLAADRPLPRSWSTRKVTAIAYETVQLPSGSLPLLYPMSEVAGCLAPQVGAHSLMKAQGGRGVLLGGVGGVANAKVVVIGAGVSGQNAANIALGMGADVTLLDTDLDKLRMSFWRYDNRVHGLASSQLTIQQQVIEADLVIGAVLIPGAKAPKLVSNDLVAQMKPGSVLVDIAVDQGGCFEDTRADHARRPDVHGPQLGVLLRREHARRGAEHLDLRADQRDAALRGGAGRQGLGAGAARRPLAGAGPEHARRVADQRARSPRRTGWTASRWRACSAERATTVTASADGAVAGRGVRAVRTYLDHLVVERGLADNTLKSYRRDLRRYVGWLAGARRGRRSTPCARTPSRRSWWRCARATPSTRRSAPGSAARTVVAVRGFHRFAVREGLTAGRPVGRRTPAGAREAAAQGAAAGRHRADPRGGRRAGHGAGAAGPGAAGGALRHRRPDLRGGRARPRRPRPGDPVSREAGPCCCAARAARSGSSRSAPTPARRSRPTWCAAARSSAVDRRGTAGGVPERPRRPAVAAERLDGAGQGRRAGRGAPPRCRRTRCGTRSPPTCSTAAPTSGWCRSCSGTPR